MQENTCFFNQEILNGDLITNRLYREEQGAFLIESFLKEDALVSLQKEVHSKRDLLKQAKPVYGGAEQRFNMRYWGTYETGTNDDEDFPLVSQFARTYDELIQPFVNKVQLSQQHVSSIGVHIYEKNNKQGLGSHRDHSNVQLVSCFVLQGYAPFYIGKNHTLADKIIFKPRRGSLLLMRGPRNEREREYTNNKNPNYDSSLDLRPIHCVGPVEQERTVIILRHILEKTHA